MPCDLPSIEASRSVPVRRLPPTDDTEASAEFAASSCALLQRKSSGHQEEGPFPQRFRSLDPVANLPVVFPSEESSLPFPHPQLSIPIYLPLPPLPANLSSPSHFPIEEEFDNIPDTAGTPEVLSVLAENLALFSGMARGGGHFVDKWLTDGRPE